MSAMDRFELRIHEFWDAVKELHLGIAQTDNQYLFSTIKKIYGDLKIYSFPSGSRVQNWEIAPDWKIEFATIKDADGKLEILDSRFGVPYLMESAKFEIENKSSELIYTSRSEGAVPWHCSAGYRPWDKPLGICIAQESLEKLSFPVEVEVATESKPGQMLVAEMSTGPGLRSNTVFLNAHTCHPGQFNDALIGIATISNVIDTLRSKKRQLKYNYRGIFGPEHIGTVFYLNKLREQGFDFVTTSHVSIYTEMTALDNPISLQESLLGDSILDRLFKFLILFKTKSRIGPFRSIVGNDETVWESVGYEVPCVSISRVSDRKYYPSYHTNHDSLDSADLNAATEVYLLIIECIEILEKDSIPIFTKLGLLCLSSPEYSLYVPWPEPTIDKDYAELTESKFAKIQDVLPRFMNGQFSCLELSIAMNIPFVELYAYLEKWCEKGLIKFAEIDGLNFYSEDKSNLLKKLTRIFGSN